MSNPVPPITDPLGSHWEQPDSNRFLFDDTHVLMTYADFMCLHEYSATQPSGVYPGKMWRRHDGFYDERFLAGGGEPEWVLRWFGVHPTEPEKYCSNHQRIILLSDGVLPTYRQRREGTA